MNHSKYKKIAASSDPILLGAHLSIAGGFCKAVHRANALGCNTFQVFTKNTSSWKERVLTAVDIADFKTAAEKSGIVQTAAHTSYLINLASPDRDKRSKSGRALLAEINRASQLGIPYVVMHPGAHMGCGETEGIRRLTEGLNQVLAAVPDATVRLLLETTAGQGTSLGHRFEHIAELIQGVSQKDRIGVCLDTAHIFAAGYDIRTQTAFDKSMTDFDTIVGLYHLRLLHLNDSKKELGSRVDRHEHIGKGTIGIECFRLIMNDPCFRSVPKIIETPKGFKEEGWDARNLEWLHSLVA